MRSETTLAFLAELRQKEVTVRLTVTVLVTPPQVTVTVMG